MITLTHVKQFLAVLASVLFMGISSSHAAIITDQKILNPFGGIHSVSGLEGTVSDVHSYSKTVTFDGFNSALGTLTGISLNVSGSRFEQVLSFGIYDYKSEFSDVVTSISKAHFNSDIDVMSDGIFEYDINDSQKRSYNLAIKDENKPSYNNYDFNGLPRSVTEYFEIDFATDLSSYIVNGELFEEISIDLNTSAWAEILSVINLTESIKVYSNFAFQEMTFDLEYTYDPADRIDPRAVPEPFIAALMGLGILGLGITRRKA